MNIANIKNLDIANGPGVRVSVYVSGCTRKCPGCFNEVAWDFDYGEPYDEGVLLRIIHMLSNPHVRGLSLLGGEPFEPKNQKEVYYLLSTVVRLLPGKDIWCFTGYTIEQLLCSGVSTPYVKDILDCIDVLVDGPFQIEKKNLLLKYRGSENQRLIDVQRTLMKGETIFWEDKYNRLV
jgi:anaerobic ribonucleoside-triphosphate reductase activating protein